MTKPEFIKQLDGKLKLVRTEYNYSQEKMAEAMGISKKTLVQIEKGRASLGWTGAVTLCALFGKSEILAMTFGGDPAEIVMALAFDSNERTYPKTLGGKIWWEEVEAAGNYRIQKNIISQHYRMLDDQDRRICSSFDYEKVKKRLEEFVRHEHLCHDEAYS